MDQQFSEHLRRIELSVNQFLPRQPDSEWIRLSFGNQPQEITGSHISPLLETTRSLVDLGGKRWRPLLLVLCARAASAEEKKEEAQETAYRLAPLVEFVHTASLIHDDIEDRSDTRRGKPAAHITYGTDTALNAGSWLYFQASVCLEQLSCSAQLKNRLLCTYLSQLRRLHLGQAMDIAWHRDSTVFPSSAEYSAMIANKTGTLASLAAEIALIICGADEQSVLRAGQAACEIGSGFQILDDVLNLTAGNPGKNRGDDIVEGKKSLPVLIFTEQHNNSAEQKLLCSYFEQAAQEGIKSRAVEKAIELLGQDGCIETARKKGTALIENGCASFMELFGKDCADAQHIRDLCASLIPENGSRA